VRVVRRALVKDPQRRLRDLGDARLELESPQAEAPAPAAVAPSRRTRIVALLAVLVLGALAGGGIMRWRQPQPVVSLRVTSRFAIPVGPQEVLARAVAISPDGRYVAYLAGPSGHEKTYLRLVGERDARVIAELPWQSPQPFFSPDSQWIAFFDAGKLKKMPVAGGVPVTLADAPTPRGGTWGADGTIVFAPISRGGLMSLPEDGGVVRPLTTLDDARGETSHRQPAFVGQSRTVLFVADGTSDRFVRAVSLDTKEVRVVRPGDALRPIYTPTGHLVYLVDAKLMASRFDARTLKLTGAPVTLVDGVDAFSFSDDGTLVYSGAPGSADSSVSGEAGGNIRTSTLVWVGRKGNVTPLPLPPDRYEHPRISADGRRIVVGKVNTDGRSVWLYDIARETLAKLNGASSSEWPVVSADGTRVFYASNRAGTQYDIVSKPIDGSGPEEVVLARPLTQIPRAVSPTGGSLVFEETYPDRPNTLWQLSLAKGGQPQPLIGKGAGEMMPTFSSDGRWVAYVSPESGHQEVVVRSSAGEDGRWQISNGGGVEPVWSFDGRDLFYRADDRMMVVDVTLGASPTFGKPRALFEGSYVFGQTEGQAFDVSRDGSRFLMMKPQRPLTATPLNVIVNWFDVLRQLP